MEKSNKKKEDLLQHFFQGNLSEEEKAAFEKLVLTDEEFAKNAAFTGMVEEGLKKEEGAEMLQRLQKIDKRRRVRKSIFYLLLIVFVSLISWWLIRTYSHPSAPFDNSDGVTIIAGIITRDSADLNLLGGDNWKPLLVAGEWEQALQLLEQELRDKGDDCNDIDSRYYAGLLYLYLRKDYARAIQNLNCTLDYTGGKPYRSDVPVHLIVAWTGEGNFRKARDLFYQYFPEADKLPENTRQLLDIDE